MTSEKAPVMPRLVRLLCLGGLLVATHGQAAQIHRCLQDGKVIISDVSCELLGNAHDLSPPIPEKHFKRGDLEPARSTALSSPTTQAGTSPVRTHEATRQMNAAFNQLLSSLFKNLFLPLLMVIVLVAWLTRKTKQAAKRYARDTLRTAVDEVHAHWRAAQDAATHRRPSPASRVEPTATAQAPKPTVWSIELIRDLEWKRFEDVCQQYYEKKGIRSETTPLGPDGGIDIRLYQDESGRPTSIVQCKAWGERRVGVGPVRELLGVMTHEKIGKAFFMTSGSYSDEAKRIAEANRITLIDGTMLLLMIQRLPLNAQQSLLSFATDGDYKTPTCPSCGVKMKSVPGQRGRPDFWGCINYPVCRQKLGMRGAQAN